MSEKTDFSYLHSNRAVLEISSFPNTKLAVIEHNLPGITLAAAVAPNPFRTSPRHGDRVEWEPLSITFLVDHDLSNWKEIYNWIVGLGAPRDKSLEYNKDLASVDMTIHTFTAQNNPNNTIYFSDCVPVALTGLNFTEEDSETVVLRATLDVEYENYRFI